MILARIISFIFHPLLMATYLFTVFAFHFPLGFEPINEGAIWKFIFLVFCFTFVLPALNIGLFKSMGTIQSVAMKTRKERILPFIFISLLYIAVSVVFYKHNDVNLNDNFLKFLLIIDALVLISTVVTFFFKVSVHSLAAWGFIGILFSLNLVLDNGAMFYPSTISIVVAGIIMSARLKLNVHTVKEVFIGAGIGLATSLVAMQLLFRY